MGPIEILVNNAAHCESPDTILEVTAGGLDRHFAVNARAPALLVHEFALQHRRSGRSHGQTGWMAQELEQQVLPSIPLRRVGLPEDIADAVVFLASRQASWITGQVIQVAGGHAL